MLITITIDIKDLKKLEKFAGRRHKFDNDPRRNPCALAIKDYQQKIGRQLQRPTVSGGGKFGGAEWKPLAPAYTRSDGTIVPVWGGVPKARGRGKVKAKLKSSATGTGKGSRYKASDRILGDRAGGMWSDFIAAAPDVADDGLSAVLTSPFKYSARQHDMRPWVDQFAGFLRERLHLRAEAALEAMIRKEGLG